ncbi:MAG: hypothetical protein WC521_04585 [Bdellovibrionales bacterium]
MRYIATVNDDSLKNGLAVSTGLHFLMFLFLFFGLPRLITPLPSHHEPVPFDIVTLAEITNTRIQDEVPEQKAAPPPPAESKPQPPTPSPAKQEAMPEAVLPKPMDKPKAPAEKPAAQQQDLLGSVLKNVAKLKPVQTANTAEQKADTKTTSSSSFGPALSSRLTITEEDALRRQISQCWNPPIGARDVQSLVVEILIDVNPDRTVANLEVVDKGRYASDSFFRAAADAAVRAVRNPKCSPLELVPEKYEQWKRIDFTFDPRDML